MNTRQTNEIINKLSGSTKNFIKSRTLLESSLFPVRSYMALGLYNLFENEYDLIREITKTASPKKIGKESKILNSEINQKTQFSIIVGYLVGREQVILDGNLEDYGGEDYDAEKIKFLFDFWLKFSKAYRNDGNLLVEDSDETISLLDEKVVDEVNEKLIAADAKKKKKILRMAAFLQSFLYLANYESRGGVFNHGPYDVGDEVLVIREFIHIGKHTYGDVSQAPPPYSNIAIGMRLKDSQIQINEVGTIQIEPVNYIDNITGINIFTRNSSLEEINLNQADKISKSAKSNMTKLFMEINEWDRRRKIIAGALQYSDLTSYAKIADIEYEHSLTERCYNDYLPEMMKKNAHEFMKKFSSREQLFSPIS